MDAYERLHLFVLAITSSFVRVKFFSEKNEPVSLDLTFLLLFQDFTFYMDLVISSATCAEIGIRQSWKAACTELADLLLLLSEVKFLSAHNIV